MMIGHSYHEKTKSNAFMIDLLKEKYSVELVYDHSWQGGEEPDLSIADDRFKAVIFWQNISRKMLKSVKCKNILYFPMYDAVYDCDIEYWHPFKDIKTVCFCRKLNEKLTRYGFNTIYVQYFPEAAQKIETHNEHSIFFWQRRPEITWSTVKKLIEGIDIKSIHIHRAVDPGQIFLSPSAEDNQNYHISYSDWFEKREDYQEVIGECDLYIAPRIYEGIGFSFLEAMAMGKVVIAADHPTMNEYIVHGQNGYLYSYQAPEPLFMDDLPRIQANAHETILNGRKIWNGRKYDIIEFIEKPNRKNVVFRFKYDGKTRLIAVLKKSRKYLKCLLPYGIVCLYQKYRRHEV